MSREDVLDSYYMVKASSGCASKKLKRGLPIKKSIVLSKKAALENFYIIKEAETAVKRDPAKWEAAKRKAKARMGGKHSARAMQLATKIYKSEGGTYAGKKPSSSSNSLKKWTKQKWQWSGGDKKRKGVYLPKRSASALKSTKAGRAKLRSASAVKARATSAGQQFSSHGLHVGKNR